MTAQWSLVLALGGLVAQDGGPPADGDAVELRAEVEGQRRELEELRARLEGMEDAVRRDGALPIDELRVNVYADVFGRADDARVFDSQGREVQDRVRARKTDFDFRAPLGEDADAVVIASLLADPVSDYEGELEEAFARLRLFGDSSWPVELKGGVFRSSFGRNNRLRLFELPQPTRPLAVTEFLGEDGYVATGGSVTVGVPTGSRHHELFFTAEGTNSGDPAAVGLAGDEPIAGTLNLDWTWTSSTALTVRSGLSGYFSRGGDDYVGGADLLFSWRLGAERSRSCQLGAELIGADTKGSTRKDPFGGYVWAQLQLADDWFAGVRYDHLERLANPSLEVDQGGVYLTWFFSDHVHLTAGYEHSEGDQGSVDGVNHVLASVDFSLGPDPLLPFWSNR